MKRWIVNVLLAVVLGTAGSMPTLAQDTQVVPEKPELAVRITPPEPYVQEQIVQTIRVVAAHVFEELVLDLPPVEGADVITLQKPKTRKFATYGGEGYIFETRRAIFPRSSGKLHIPMVRVSGAVGISKNERESFALKSAPAVIEIKPPPADFSEDDWLVARKVEIEERWSKPPDELRVGDHVTRFVEATVTGATGGHIPELDHGRSSGVTILPGQIERSTEVTANQVVGKISRAFELRIDTDQPINISPVRLVWWNTDSEIEWRSAAKSVRIEALPRDVEKLVEELMAEADQAHKTGRYGVMAITASGVFAAFGLMVWSIAGMKKRRPEDRILANDLRHRPDPISAVSALLRWGETTFPDDRPLSMEKLSQRLGPDAGEPLARLQRAAFGSDDQAVDSRAVIQEILTLARDRRSRSLADICRACLRYLIGPKRHLPRIDGQSPHLP